MLLTMTACGSDEPQDNILYLPATQMMNHSYNTVEEQLDGVKYGAVQAYINVTKKTAQLAFLCNINGESITVQLTDAPVTFDSMNSGYVIQSTAPITVGTHTVNSLRAFIEVRDIQRNLRHHVKAIIDNKYEVNGLMTSIFFNDVLTSITHDSDIDNETGSAYNFIFSDLATDNKTATMNVSGINRTPFTTGASYAGITVEPCDVGLHLYHNEDTPINNSNGVNNQLIMFEGTINMRDLSFNVLYELEGVGIMNANGNMF